LTKVIDLYIVIAFLKNYWSFRRHLRGLFSRDVREGSQPFWIPGWVEDSWFITDRLFECSFSLEERFSANYFEGDRIMKDPVANFWGHIEYALDQGGFRYILEDLVSKVRKQLDDSSMTAQAIDRHDSYADIAGIAQKDGLEDFALALRFAKD